MQMNFFYCGICCKRIVYGNPTCYEPFKRRVLFHTTCSEYFKQNVHMFEALNFLAKLTQPKVPDRGHVPPKGLQLIRRYGLYTSRTKGRWNEIPWIAERASEGWKASLSTSATVEDLGYEPLSESAREQVDIGVRKRAWARLLSRVYEGCAPPSTRWSVRSAARR
jgi:hypothetical protein